MGLSITSCTPEKKFSRVGCRASATANDVIPNEAIIGVIEIPKVPNSTKAPTDKTLTLIMPLIILCELKITADSLL